MKIEKYYKQFGFNVRRQRLLRGWTQQNLANRLLIERTSITNIELGRQRVLLHHVMSFAKVFRVKPTLLMKDVFK